MFICNDCGHVFEEPKEHREYHPYGDTYAYETFACCPNCGGSIDEAEECPECGEYFSSEDMCDTVCKSCFEEYRERVARAIFKEFTEEEFKRLPDGVFDYVWDDVEIKIEVHNNDKK